MRFLGLNKTFASLSVPVYRTLWIGTVLAFLSFMMSFTAQAVVAFDLSGTNRAVGLVALGQGAAMLMLAPIGGVLADRLSKRFLLLLGQATVGGAFLAIAVLILTDSISILLLASMTFVMGTAFSLLGPARQAYVGEMVPSHLLPNAVALSQLANAGTRVIGPFIAGVLIGVGAIGAGGTYLLMAALYIPVLLTLFQLPPSTRTNRTRSVRQDLLAGIEHVRARPRLRLAMLAFIATLMVTFPMQVVLPGLLENHLDHPARSIGVLMGVSAASGFSVGLLLAAIAGGRWGYPIMLGLMALMAIALGLLAIAPSFGVALLVMVPMGIGQSGFMLVNNTLIMGESEPAYYGRMQSLFMLAFASQALASFPFGLIADAIGERETLGIMGALAIAITAVTALALLTVRRREADARLPGAHVQEIGPPAGGAAP